MVITILSWLNFETTGWANISGKNVSGRSYCLWNISLYFLCYYFLYLFVLNAIFHYIVGYLNLIQQHQILR